VAYYPFSRLSTENPFNWRLAIDFWNGGQIPRAENGVIYGGDAQPEAVFKDVLGAAAEG
jgi:hypothetical protein